MRDVSKARVLFVDDEPLILELFQMATQTMPGGWESRVAESGEKALQIMERESFDLVVSDMRMPGMTGAQLLNEVMKRHPATGRILLSGQADRADVLRCIGATHQFLAKPCELSALQAALNRTRSLREQLRSDEIQKLVVRRESLPSIPAVYFQLLDALQDPDCPVDRIAEIVATDAALLAKLLQLVNSAFFGYAREISSAKDAVMLLGTGTLRTLALATRLFSAFQTGESEGRFLQELWRHSLRVAQAAKVIAQEEGAAPDVMEQAYTAGLLHDVGKVILTDQRPDAYMELNQRAAKERRVLVELERELLGAAHPEVGAYLLDLWGLPAALVEAVALHHEPGRAGGLAFCALTAVHVANALEEGIQDPEPHPLIGPVDSLYLDQLGVSSRFPRWRERLALSAT